MKCSLNYTVFAVALMVSWTGADAQPNLQSNAPLGTQSSPPGTIAPAAIPSPPIVAAPVPLPLPLPLINPAKELKGTRLVEALRNGGLVLYMRHAQTGEVTEMCNKSNLSSVGEDQARMVGAALRELKVPVGVVWASQPCRTGDTARLLGLGPVQITEDLNPLGAREGFDVGAARLKRLSEMPPKGTNSLLVSHLHGSRKKTEWLHLEMAEIIVFRPQGNAGAEPVARIPLAGWPILKNAVLDGSSVR